MALLLHCRKVHVHFLSRTQWNFLFLVSATFRMAGDVHFGHRALHLQGMFERSVQLLNGHQQRPHVLPDPTLCCAVLPDFQLYCVPKKTKFQEFKKCWYLK